MELHRGLFTGRAAENGTNRICSVDIDPRADHFAKPTGTASAYCVVKALLEHTCVGVCKTQSAPQERTYPIIAHVSGSRDVNERGENLNLVFTKLKLVAKFCSSLIISSQCLRERYATVFTMSSNIA